jgi:hypothetical protein
MPEKIPEDTRSEIHVNDLTRRKELRQRSGYGTNDGLYSSRTLHHFLNTTPATEARVAQRVTKLPALLETTILRVCRQTHAEAHQVMYLENTFIIMFYLHQRPRPFHTMFPSGINVSLIRSLHIEIQLNLFLAEPRYPTAFARASTWTTFGKMPHLKTVQLVVTFHKPLDPGEARLFAHDWRPISSCDNALQELVAAIPGHVQVQYGLTEEQTERGDYGGFDPVESSVLEKICKCGSPTMDLATAGELHADLGNGVEEGNHDDDAAANEGGI